jgi:hypothetical protein
VRTQEEKKELSEQGERVLGTSRWVNRDSPKWGDPTTTQAAQDTLHSCTWSPSALIARTGHVTGDRLLPSARFAPQISCGLLRLSCTPVDLMYCEITEAAHEKRTKTPDNFL